MKPVSILTLLVMIILSACASPSTQSLPPSPRQTPTSAPPGPAPNLGGCGDGICDEKEQANPALCPQDCMVDPADEPKEEEGEWSPEYWWAEITWGCDFQNPGSSNSWTVDIIYEFAVDGNGVLSGSGTGEGRNLKWMIEYCECSLSLDPFTVAISGSKQGDKFTIHMDPEYNMVETCTCPSGPINAGGLKQLEICTCQTTPLVITIDAKDGGYASWECSVVGNGITEGWITLHQGKP